MIKEKNIIEQSMAIITRKINNKVEFLLAQEKGGLWTFPGGAKESKDSTIEDAMRRELREELGFEIQDYDLEPTKIQARCLYDSDPSSSRHGKTGLIYLFFVHPHDISTLQATTELKKIQWANLDSAKKMFSFDCHRELIKKAAKKLGICREC